MADLTMVPLVDTGLGDSAHLIEPGSLASCADATPAGSMVMMRDREERVMSGSSLVRADRTDLEVGA